MRNKYRHIIFTALSLLLLTSCEKDLPVYDDHQGYLYFSNINSTDYTTTDYSFVYSGGKERDTVWIKLQAMGFLSDHDRDFELQQVATGDSDAIAGVHYVSFDSDEEKPYLKIPAGQTAALVPVFVLRDPSLKSMTVKLKIEVKPNENFNPGYKEQRTKIITITDQLMKPSGWTGTMDYYFGSWGPVKFQFMLDVTGQKWDNDYINSVIADQGMTNYLISKLRRALDEENTRRAGQGLAPLQEADGTLVTFR